MRLDVESAQGFVPPSVVNPNIAFNAGLSGPQEYLRSGVNAAQAGDKATARAMFLRSSELNPNDPNVWLWLASISEYPEELMGFVEKVLDLDPYNERALQWRTATCTLLAKTFVQRGSDAAESDQPMYAEDCFAKALQYDPKNTAAMMWLASLTNDEQVRREHLERIIEIEPDHQAAKTAIGNMAAEKEKAEFAEIRRVAVEGDVASAAEMLAEFTARYPEHVDSWMLLSHLATEPRVKMSALGRVLEIDSDHQVARTSLDSLVSLFGELHIPAPIMEPEVPEVHEEVQVEAEPSAEEESFDEAPIAPPVEQILLAETPVIEVVEPTVDQVEEQPVEEPVQEFAFHAEQPAVESEEEPEPVQDFAFHAEQPAVEPEAELAPQPEQDAEPEISAVAEDDDEVAPVPVPEWQSFDAPSENDWDRRTEAYTAEEIKVSQNLQDFASFDEPQDEDPYSIPMPEAALSEELASPERTGFETTVAPAPEPEPAPGMTCPYCSAENDAVSFSCRSCKALLTLADLESLIDNKNADTYLIRRAVDAMESDRSGREFDEVELTTLGIGHLNLRNLQFGYDRLYEASNLNPNNIVLSSQVNSLLIRMDEIRRQEEVHATMATGKNILVVDDSPTIRKLIAGKLEKSGHNVLLCEDGEKALEAIRTHVPDLVLLDIKMPGMDGYDVCRQIRGWNSSANVPIVMISGKDGYFDKMRGQMAGSTGYITKPFGPETLMKAVEFYLGGGEEFEIEAVDAAEVEEHEHELAMAD